MAASQTARPVRRSGECVCELLGAAATDVVTIDTTPANRISGAGDRALVLNVAQVALSIHVGTASAMDWNVEDDAEDERILNVMFRFPAKTCFTDQQIEIVKLVNRLRVRSVWVQPEDDCVYIGVAVWRSDAVGEFVVQDIVIIRRASEPDEDPEETKAATSRKRARVSKRG